MKVYPKDSGLAAWSENCKWYSSLPLAAVVFVSQSSDFCLHNPLCCFSTSLLFASLSTQSGNFWIHPRKFKMSRGEYLRNISVISSLFYKRNAFFQCH